MSKYGIARDVLDAVGNEKFLKLLRGWDSNEVWHLMYEGNECSPGCYESNHLYLSIEQMDRLDQEVEIKFVESEEEYDQFFHVGADGEIYDLGPKPLKIDDLKIGSYFVLRNYGGGVTSVGRKALIDTWRIDGIMAGYSSEKIREMVNDYTATAQFFNRDGEEVEVA